MIDIKQERKQPKYEALMCQKSSYS